MKVWNIKLWSSQISSPPPWQQWESLRLHGRHGVLPNRTCIHHRADGWGGRSQSLRPSAESDLWSPWSCNQGNREFHYKLPQQNHNTRHRLKRCFQSTLFRRSVVVSVKRPDQMEVRPANSQVVKKVTCLWSHLL